MSDEPGPLGLDGWAFLSMGRKPVGSEEDGLVVQAASDGELIRLEDPKGPLQELAAAFGEGGMRLPSGFVEFRVGTAWPECLEMIDRNFPEPPEPDHVVHG